MSDKETKARPRDARFFCREIAGMLRLVTQAAESGEDNALYIRTAFAEIERLATEASGGYKLPPGPRTPPVPPWRTQVA